MKLLKIIQDGIVRSGYHQAAHELDRAGFHRAATNCRNAAKLVGVN